MTEWKKSNDTLNEDYWKEYLDGELAEDAAEAGLFQSEQDFGEEVGALNYLKDIATEDLRILKMHEAEAKKDLRINAEYREAIKKHIERGLGDIFGKPGLFEIMDEMKTVLRYPHPPIESWGIKTCWDKKPPSFAQPAAYSLETLPIASVADPTEVPQPNPSAEARTAADRWVAAEQLELHPGPSAEAALSVDPAMGSQSDISAESHANEDIHVYLDLVRRWEKVFVVQKGVEIDQEFRFVNLDRAPSYPEAIAGMNSAIQELLDTLNNRIGLDDYVQVRLEGGGISKPLHPVRRHRNALSAEEFVAAVCNLFQSSAEIRGGATLKLVAIIINLPGGCA
ncbi:uncharacterized protein LOC128323541 [Hemicordylus capensis]|uniref:uncharacterized protein LOC128323541 n=1 Tax=Hemicordylus capensis TaxID=884348 RepID=UPI0023023E66|nr:uncharacterized protein LOC128323541 [Hemicordylus capensis]